ncbi:MAG TPA: AAA family ATPase [Solirubrobacterales bacterium]|jgi:class 3 adenylate cyclase
METSCARCGAAAAGDARFCAACGAPLEPAGDAERKLATLVFADLVGSTELVSGRDPEEVRRLLEPFFELSRATLEEHGGRVEKFIGDAVVAAFGVPRAHGDDPDRAVAAALALVERLGERSAELALRIGIETGEVLVSADGGDLSVTGDAAHAAARLQQAAEPGEILLGARAAGASRAATLDEHAPIDAKGFAAPLQAWRVLGIKDAAALAETPFLGRGGELETLRLTYLAAVRERSPRMALVVGEAGAGKTRLGRELLADLARTDQAPTVLVGRNPAYGDGIAFWALAEILRAAAGAADDAGSAEVREALEARLTGLGATHAEETARVLAATLAGGDGGPEVASLRRAWRRLISELSNEGPVVIAVDDAHWADEGFLDLIDDAVSLPGCPLMVICTARPEIGERRPELGDGHERLALEPLAPAAAQELAATLVAGRDAGLAREIAEASGGNPFFAEEIAHALGDGSGPQAGALPDTVQAAIAARLDGLPGAEKRTLQRAAVLGDRFRLEALRELSEEPPEPALAELEARALIEPLAADERGLYGFRHQLIREVAYSSLTRAERARLHESAAEGVRGRAGDRYAELSEVIAFHIASAAELEPSAQRLERAFEAAREAGELALRRAAPARAQELLEQAARFAPDSEGRIGALAEAADIALSVLRGDHTFRLLRELGAAAEEAGDEPGAALYYARATEVASRMAGISGSIEEATIAELLARARELATDPDPQLRAQLRLGDVWIAWRSRRLEEMAAGVGEALELARLADDVRLLSSALDAASATGWTEGRFEDSTAHNRERVEVLGRLPERSGIIAFERSDALNMLAESLVYSGELREAIHWADLCSEEMSSSAAHIAGALALRPLYMLGEWDEVLRRGADVRESWISEGRPPVAFFSPSFACVASIHGFRGDEAEQGDWMQVAELAADGSEQQLPGLRMLAADVALHVGDHELAIELLQPLEVGFTWRDPILAKRAEALALAGDPQAASTLDLVESLTTADAHTLAVAVRARGLLQRDDSLLAVACERFQALECICELARTEWLRGGEHRERGAETFDRLGAVPPA